jgi:predicted CXXCH cytochrome family protein
MRQGGRRARRGWRIAIFLVALVALCPSIIAQAALPSPHEGDPEACQACHADETAAWQNSPHAQHQVACSACHGPYVAGHPKTGPMPIDVESESCAACHAETYSQWQNSLHASKGVQCIGCHLSHSQQFRLTDQALCSSCHRQVSESFTHTTHRAAGVTCIDCHLSAATGGEQPALHSHSFAVAADVCLSCHSQSIHGKSSSLSGLASERAPADSSPSAREAQLANEVAALTRANRSLQALSLATLGLGLGIGGALGVAFVLAVSAIVQARRRP